MASYNNPGDLYPGLAQVAPHVPEEPAASEQPPAHPTVATAMSTANYKDTGVPFPDLSILLALEQRRASSKATTQPKGSDHASIDSAGSWSHQRPDEEPIAQSQELALGDTPEPQDQAAPLGQVNGDAIQPMRQSIPGSEYRPFSGSAGLTNPDSRPTSSLGSGEDLVPHQEPGPSPSVVHAGTAPVVRDTDPSQGLSVETIDNDAPDSDFMGGENSSPINEKESIRDQPSGLSRQQYREAAKRATFYLHGLDKLDQYIYSEANQMNRPDAPKSNVPVHTLPSGPVPTATQWGYYDPRVHWTWERPPEWYQSKMQEIAQRGNRKSKERFGRGFLSLARRLSGPKDEELPERVRRNRAWLAAVEEIRQMEEQGRRRQREEARLDGKDKEGEEGPKAIYNNHDDDDDDNNDYEVMMGGAWQTISRRTNSAGHHV
jgi:hypothetical protein